MNKVLLELKVETDVNTASKILDYISEVLNKQESIESRGNETDERVFNMSKPSNKGPRY